MPGLTSNQDSTSTYSIDCLEDVYAVEFCPFEGCEELLAYGGNRRLAIGVCHFAEEDLQSAPQFEHLTDFHHGTPVSMIAWSPKTSIQHLPHSLQFCTVGADKKMRCFISDGRGSTTVHVMDGHKTHINDVTVDPFTGEQAATTSDDHTCRLWDLHAQVQKTCIPLDSPGMAVQWNLQEPNKLMVAQKNGVIRFYDLVSEQPIMSLRTDSVPLMSADWSSENPMQLGAVARHEWLLWDMHVSSLPRASQQAHLDGVCRFRWSHVHKNIFATCGRPGNEINVYHMGHCQMPVSCSLPVGGGLSWHAKLPICAAGGGCKVHLWLVEN